MAELCLIALDDAGLKLAGSVMHHVPDIETPEDAVMWALQQAASSWEMEAQPTWQWKPKVSAAPSSGKPVSIQIPEHFPLGHRTLAEVDFFKLPGAIWDSSPYTLLVATDTLKKIVPDETNWSECADTSILGELKL